MPNSPRTTCPVCYQADVHFMPTASKLAEVDYFMCGKCLNIWIVPKRGDETFRLITNPQDTAKRRGGI